MECFEKKLDETANKNQCTKGLLIFTDRPKPVINHDVKIVDGNNAEVSWDQGSSSQRPEKFKISWWSNENNERTAETNSKNYMITGLSYGKYYSVNVVCLAQNTGGRSEVSDTVYFQTAPLEPQNLLVENYDASPNDTIVISFDDDNEWEVLYEINLRQLNFEFRKEEEKKGNAETPLKDLTFVRQANNRRVIIDSLKPGHSYSVSVTAVQKSEEKIQKSKTIFCKHYVTTYPDVPGNFKKECKDGTLVFTWDRPAVRPLNYVVQWNENAEKHHEEVWDEIFYINNLKPSTPYRIRVAAVSRAGRGDFSEECEHVTAPEPITHFDVVKLQFSSATPSWYPPRHHVDQFVIKFHQDGDDLKQYFTKDPNFRFNQLRPGRKCHIAIACVVNNNTGEYSLGRSFFALPGTPRSVKVILLSTREVAISCQPVFGASKYIFKISGQDYEEDEPKHVLKHDEKVTEFSVTVYAQNTSGRGPPSEKKEFRQTLLYLQKKYHHRAFSIFPKEAFIEPKFTGIENVYEEAISAIFHINNGETNFIQGAHFAGKTAICCYYLQIQDEKKLGIFLDCNEYQNCPLNMSIEQLLRRSMSDISDEEMSLVFEWMKDHSDQVIIIIDNLTLPFNHDTSVPNVKNVDKVNRLFINLTRVNRELLPDSRVLCTSTEENVCQVIHPTRSVRIDGFDEKRVNMMKTSLTGDETYEIPKHLKYFCVSPSLCKIIVQHLKDEYDFCVDVESYSSVLMKVLKVSLKKGAEMEKEIKLKEIVRGIRHEQKSSMIPDIDSAGDAPSVFSSTTQRSEKTCTSLQHQWFKALFLSLMCSLENFELEIENFRKAKVNVDSKAFVMACGLLTEHNSEIGTELFKSTEETFDKELMKSKKECIVSFISDKKSRQVIMKHITKNPQMVLDWCDICYETDMTETMKPIAFELKNNLDHNEIISVYYFLRHCRWRTAKVIQIKYPRKPIYQLSLAVANASRVNPDAKKIIFDGRSTFSRSSSKRKSQTSSLL